MRVGGQPREFFGNEQSFLAFGYIRCNRNSGWFMSDKADKRDFYNYFSQNLIKGFIYLAVLIGLIILLKSLFSSQYEAIEHALSDNYTIMSIVFLISEFFVGIIPPELFMAWMLDEPWYYYVLGISIMTIASLFAGWLNYRLGMFISTKAFFMDLFKRRFKLDKYKQRYEKYGSGIIIVAALTPLPFALISLLTGTLSYPQRKYLIFASFRIIRFVVYGIIIFNLGEVI